ncbi:MAG: NAD(P)-dependent oxidoreductase [Kiritimatiellaeota bacterium]|nr:NAD(P)-dependent oxidoreductase [Kiritimatiellota bacterium]
MSSQHRRVLVTGASGHLGSRVANELAERGYAVTALDMVPPPDTVRACVRRAVVGSLADPDIATEAVRDIEAIVHCAALHPWKAYSDDQYLDANVKGAWHLYRAAAAAGVRRVVLTSSIAAPGMHGIPPSAWPVPETAEFPIVDLYGFTKHAQEDLAKCFANSAGTRTIALRPPPFMPRPELETGFSLTACFALVEDIAGAHVAALEVLLGARAPEPDHGPADFEAVNVTNSLPYTPEDAAMIGPDGDMRPLVRKYWPAAADWLEARGYRRAGPLIVYDLHKARQLLKWTPKYNFEQWFAKHAAGD